MSVSTQTLALAIIVAVPAAAYAEAPSKAAMVLRPGTRSMAAIFSVAPAFALDNNLATQVKLGQAFAWHVSGDASGFAIGGELQESIGASSFVFNMGPKAWYDIQVSDELGIYLAPSVMMGLAYATANSQSAFGFNMQFGFEAKMLVQDRGMVFFRPVTVDIAIGDQTAVRWDLVFGGGVTF